MGLNIIQGVKMNRPTSSNNQNESLITEILSRSPERVISAIDDAFSNETFGPDLILPLAHSLENSIQLSHEEMKISSAALLRAIVGASPDNVEVLLSELKRSAPEAALPVLLGIQVAAEEFDHASLEKAHKLVQLMYNKGRSYLPVKVAAELAEAALLCAESMHRFNQFAEGSIVMFQGEPRDFLQQAGNRLRAGVIDNVGGGFSLN